LSVSRLDSLSCPAQLSPNRALPSWGSVGWGPVIPTQSLTPKERQWNFDNQAKYEAQDSAEWLRQHGMGPFSFFR